jgi:hypothetical protein
MANSILYYSAMMSLWEWVSPRNRGLATGLINTARVVSILLMLIFELGLLNRDGIITNNNVYPRAIIDNFKTFLAIFGSIQAFFMLTTMVFYKRNEITVVKE